MSKAWPFGKVTHRLGRFQMKEVSDTCDRRFLAQLKLKIAQVFFRFGGLTDWPTPRQLSNPGENTTLNPKP